MRIGIITRRVGRHDGQGRVNLEIAREALRQGHAVRLFAEHADPEILDLGADLVRLAPPAFLPGRLLRDQLLALRSAAAARGCDALLANGFSSWARAEVNAVHFVHGAWQDYARRSGHAADAWRSPRGAYAALYGAANARLERLAFARAGKIVAVSAKVRDELMTVGVPAARITTILNGVDAADFVPGPSDRPALGLPDQVPLVLFAGDLRTPRKNLDTVLRAVARVDGLHLAVAGRHEGTPWPALAARLGIGGRTHFLGFRTDMAALMRAAALFVFPSRYEACSLVLLEAMASGLPVVTASSTGGAEIVRRDAGIVLPDCEDDAALAGALRDLLADPAGRRQMALRARAIALRHGWRDMAQTYLRLLEAPARRQSPATRHFAHA